MDEQLQLRAVEWKRVARSILIRCPHCTLMERALVELDPKEPATEIDYQCGSCHHTERVRLERRRG